MRVIARTSHHTPRVYPALLASHDEASREVRKAAALRVVTVQRGTMLDALRIRAECQLAWWDSVHLETAKEHGCTRMLTEDMPSQPVIEGVVYENPLAPEQRLDRAADAVHGGHFDPRSVSLLKTAPP